MAQKLERQGPFNDQKKMKLRLLFELMHSVLVHDLAKSLDVIKNLASELKYSPKSDALKLFSAISVLGGSSKLSAKSKDTLVREGRQSLEKWVSD